jgi:hypothetical protein
MRAAAGVLMIALGLACGARAQDAAAPTDEAVAAKLALAEELADQNRRSEALNAAVNAKNREVEARNTARRAAFDKALADYKATLAAQEQAKARDQAAYAKAMADWNAAVAACKAGEVSKCDKPGTGKAAAP